MTHIWFCSIWKLHLIPVTALGLPKFLHFQEFALILFDTSVTVWGMYIQSKLCVSSKQSSGLNEAFMGSYLLKVNSAGCALGHMVQHSSHQLCVWIVRSISRSWLHPLMPSLPLLDGQTEISHITGSVSKVSKPFLGLCHTCVPVSKLVGDLCLNLWQQLT